MLGSEMMTILGTSPIYDMTKSQEYKKSLSFWLTGIYSTYADLII